MNTAARTGNADLGLRVIDTEGNPTPGPAGLLTDIAVWRKRGGRDVIRHFKGIDPAKGGCGLCRQCLARKLADGQAFCVLELPHGYDEELAATFAYDR
jgi:hypothetical protein